MPEITFDDDVTDRLTTGV